jgi:hypothetical protein
VEVRHPIPGACGTEGILGGEQVVESQRPGSATDELVSQPGFAAELEGVAAGDFGQSPASVKVIG